MVIVVSNNVIALMVMKGTIVKLNNFYVQNRNIHVEEKTEDHVIRREIMKKLIRLLDVSVKKAILEKIAKPSLLHVKLIKMIKMTAVDKENVILG